MCGIAGFIGSGTEVDLNAMTAAMAHRGPDGAAAYVDPDLRVYLGHRRLAVVDLASGAQPMGNEDGRVVVIFNGEIYNHRTLRAELQVRGHVFRSDHSDTEVLVHGWEEWGEALPERLEGMFAFAVLDRRQKILFLARDPFGKKPLFYATAPNCFAFASELDALARHSKVSREPDRLALKKFFAHTYFPGDATPYQNIRKLGQGSWMRVSMPDLQTRQNRYWRFSIANGQPPSGKPADWACELQRLLARAVEKRLESDVPLGVLLSGGIDSSAMLALMARYREPQMIDAFCMGFTEKSYDESAHAKFMADHIGCRLHTEICDFNTAEAELPKLLAEVSEPMGDNSLLPTYFVCRLARRSVTVALAGDGGDELFAGYDVFSALRASYLHKRLVPNWLRGMLVSGVSKLPKSTRNMSLDFKAHRWLKGIDHPEPLWNPVWLSGVSPVDIAVLFGDELDTGNVYAEVQELWLDGERRGLGPVDLNLEYFTRFYLTDDILVKADRASMMNSLELRAPFLDRDLVAFVRQLPHAVKLQGNVRKAILKRALQGILPESILRRRKKGFSLPMAKWLKELPIPIEAIPFVDQDVLKRAIAEHRAGKHDNRHLLWSTLALGHWFAARSQGG